MTQSSNAIPVSGERLAEMLAGLKGVTPGPWDTAVGLVRSIDGDEAIPIFETRAPWKKHRRIATVARQEWHNGHHIARCDPDTMRSILTELLTLRATKGELVEALSASAGYLRNAKIDLETGCTKAVAVRTIEGGLRMVEVALSRSGVSK